MRSLIFLTRCFSRHMKQLYHVVYRCTVGFGDDRLGPMWQEEAVKWPKKMTFDPDDVEPGHLNVNGSDPRTGQTDAMPDMHVIGRPRPLIRTFRLMMMKSRKKPLAPFHLLSLEGPSPPFPRHVQFVPPRSSQILIRH